MTPKAMNFLFTFVDFFCCSFCSFLNRISSNQVSIIYLKMQNPHKSIMATLSEVGGKITHPHDHLHSLSEATTNVIPHYGNVNFTKPNPNFYYYDDYKNYDDNYTDKTYNGEVNMKRD